MNFLNSKFAMRRIYRFRKWVMKRDELYLSGSNSESDKWIVLNDFCRKYTSNVLGKAFHQDTKEYNNLKNCMLVAEMDILALSNIDKNEFWKIITKGFENEEG